MKFRVKAFLLGVMFSALLIIAKNIYSCELSTHVDKGIYRAMKVGSIEDLYIGSSMFRKAINLCDDENDSFLIYYNGLDPAFESIILEYLFKNGLAVKNLYVDMFTSATNEPWLSDTRIMFDSPFVLKLPILRQAMKNPKAGIISTPWELLLQAGNEMFIMWPIYRGLVAERYCRGGYSAGTLREGRTAESMALLGKQRLESSTVNSAQRQAIIRIMELCREYGVSVKFIETPKYSPLLDTESYMQIMKEYAEILRLYGVKCVISNRTAELVGILSGMATVYDFPQDDPSMYEDRIHLSAKGSLEFMRILRGVLVE